MTAFQGNIKNVPRNIFIMLMTIGIFAIVVIVSLSFMMANTVDKISQEKSKRIIAAKFDGSMTNLATLTQDYSDWNAAYEWITERDDEAVYSGVGSGATESGFFDKLIIYADADTPIYAYKAEGVESDINNDIPEISRKYITLAYATVTDTTQVLSGVELIENEYAMVFASRVWPDPLGDIDINTLPVMITIAWIDDAFISDVAKSTLKERLRISTEITDSSNALPLFNLEGEKIASLQWKGETPSAELLTRMSGYIAALSVFFILATVAVGKVSSSQTKAYMHAHSQARTDPLTGLLNRTGLTDTVNGKTVKEDMNAGRMAILYLDIDKFKHINDQYGHDTGDAALCKIADRLQFAVRSSDHIARLGGDEFILVIIDDNPEQAALKACERLLEDAEHVLHINSDTSLHLHLSIGIALSGQNTDWRSLVVKADSAMYEAKKSGSGYKFANFANKAPKVNKEQIKTKRR